MTVYKNIKVSKVTKITTSATIIGMLITYIFLQNLMFFVPIISLLLLMIFYPGCEKIGTKGVAEYMQAALSIVFITFVVFVISMI